MEKIINRIIKISIKDTQIWKRINIEWKVKIKWNFNINVPKNVKIWDKLSVNWVSFEIENIINTELDNLDRSNKNMMIVVWLFILSFIIFAFIFAIFKGYKINTFILWFLFWITLMVINKKFPR